MAAKKKAAKKKAAPAATDRHIGVRVTPGIAEALETVRARLARERPGSNVTLSDVVRIQLHAAIEGATIRLSPLALRAAIEGGDRAGTTPSAYIEQLILDAIPEAE